MPRSLTSPGSDHRAKRNSYDNDEYKDRNSHRRSRRSVSKPSDTRHRDSKYKDSKYGDKSSREDAADDDLRKASSRNRDGKHRDSKYEHSRRSESSNRYHSRHNVSRRERSPKKTRSRSPEKPDRRKKSRAVEVSKSRSPPAKVPTTAFRRAFRFDSPPPEERDAFIREFGDCYEPEPGEFDNSTLYGPEALATKAARELYIGNLPHNIDTHPLLEFINLAISTFGASLYPGNAALRCWIASDGHYAFAELRTMEEASNCMVLSGINFNGCNLRIGRPKTFPQEMLATVPSPTIQPIDPSLLSRGIQGYEGATALPGIPPVPVAKSKDRPARTIIKPIEIVSKPAKFTEMMCIYEFKLTWSEQKITEYLSEYGKMTHCSLVLDSKGKSTGVCVCEFLETSYEDRCIAALQKKEKYTIMKATEFVQSNKLDDFVEKNMYDIRLMSRCQVPTRIIFLSKLIRPQDLANPHDLGEIFLDLKTECECYGQVVNAIIPQTTYAYDSSSGEEKKITVDNGTGYAFVEFLTVNSAAAARKAFSGRKYRGRMIQADYMDEYKYFNNILGQPKPHYSVPNESISQMFLL